MSAKSATIYRLVNERHWCPHGLKAKDLLERYGYSVRDEHLRSPEAANAFKAKHEVSTTPQIFIDGQRIGGHDDLRRHLGLSVRDPKALSYRPVIAIFAVTALMALAVQLAGGFASAQGASGSWLAAFMPWLMSFVAFSMCVLATLKLRDLDAFSGQFLGYDLLARRVVRYAYVYPFAEAFVGVGMLLPALHVLVAPVGLFIGGIGAVSVIKAVYIDRRELKCACVGGNSNVPLGFVSLTENLMMVVMALWMLASA